MSLGYPSSVSIIMAAYNSGTTIERAVRSALGEPEASDVIVVDDGSTHDTLAQDKKALRRHYLGIDCRLQWRLMIFAVKQRSLKQSLATFLRSLPVPVYLLRQLLEQVTLRVGRRVRPRP